MNNVPSSLTFSIYRPELYPEFQELMQLCYADMGGEHASKEEMDLLSRLYPEGQILAMVDGKLAGAALARIVPAEKFLKPHRQSEVLDLSTYESDAMIGQAVYGMDIFVHPDYRTFKTANLLHQKTFEQVASDNFTDYLGASRVSNYAKYADTMSLEEYADQVRNRKILDRALSFHLFNKMELVDVIHHFNEGDVSSLGCGTVMRRRNTAYDPSRPVYPARFSMA